MDAIATNDKSKQPGPYGGPAPPAPPGVHHPMPPSEASHGHPPPPQPQPPPGPQQGMYDPYRYPPYEEANREQQPQPHHQHPQQPPPQQQQPTHGLPQPQHGHPVPQAAGPAPPQHPPGAPYAHPGAVSGPPPSPQDIHHHQQANYRPMNGATHEHPHPRGDYRPGVGYPPPHEGHPNSEIPPTGHPMPHPEVMHQHAQHVPGQFVPVNTPHSHTPGTYDPGSYFHNQPGAPYRPPSQQQPQSTQPTQPPQQQQQGGRRTTRAQQACDQCRARKAKCDEGRPACSNCKEGQLGCVYKEVPPHKQEKATQQLIDKLDQIAERAIQLGEVQATQNQILKEHSEQLTKLLSQQSSQSPPRKVARTSAAQKSPGSDTVAHERRFVTDQTSSLKPRYTPNQTAHSFSSTQPGDGEVKEEVAPDGKLAVEGDGELSIPIEHTTAAHKLLLWPSIRKLLSGWDDDYVMNIEEKRGLIRVYGQGEGDDRSDFALGPDSPIINSPSSQADHEQTQVYSPSAVWGTVATPHGMEIPKSPRAQIGGLNAKGFLNTDANMVQQFHQSYVKNMHILHPFLDLKDLHTMVAEFIQKYSPPRKKTLATQFIPSNNADNNPYHRVAKRKRSSETLHGFMPDAGSSPNSSSSGISVPPVARTITNATVLLVLALGSICECKDVLPGPARDPNSDFPKFPQLSNAGHAGLSPATSDPGVSSGTYASSANNNFPVPGDNRTTLGRSYSTGGYQESSDPSLKNMDVIPGMAYFAYATDILGNLQGGNRLSHVHACLLAGLYTGQLAHPFASHGWISQASRACQVLVRPRRYQKLEEGPQKDLIDFAYWTCLQLESDILAELDLPASGISRSEGRIALPLGVHTHVLPNEAQESNNMIMFYYSSQIHLRKALNRVHTDLYKPDKLGSEDPQTRWSTNIQIALSTYLEEWRQHLPPNMKWSDDDPPAREINTARMRAKYYGAKYIIYRPLLHHALHPIPPPKERSLGSAKSPASIGSKSQQVSPSLSHSHRASSMVRRSSEMGPPGYSAAYQNQTATPFKKLDPKLQEACRICIDSAIRSTTAFDGVEGRPIVTNIFGTAHAQFGNMLVLSATYMSNLSELVDGERLRTLLKRTIDFLQQSRFISPTLKIDAEILTEIYHKIFDDNAVTSSFGSN
ncbi:hypothetical protein FQN54_000855 [Arachnomyces sp. PD_36]|nr:hypothetical protein FQN54_000855 [Arachnomyces sp. PD_36]